MGQVKEVTRNLIIESAGHYLTEQEEGDLFSAYEALKEAEDAGNGDAPANNYVDVWGPLEYKSVNEILDLIDAGVGTLETTMLGITELSPLGQIDWKELRKQKHSLLQAMVKLENRDVEDSLIPDLDGILHLIDSLQDYAVDVMGENEDDVMLFSKEED